MTKTWNFGVLKIIAAVALTTGLAVGRPEFATAATAPGDATAVLAGGCFWGMEEVFSALKGVDDVTVGYTGGAAATAHYDMVSNGDTGHAESIRIRYNPHKISYEQLLKVYFLVAHDPTQLNAQAPDEGPQYRSEIFYADDGQRATALAEIAKLARTHHFASPIVTKVDALGPFYPAEAYHQHYARLHPDNPYIVSVDTPRMNNLRTNFPTLLK